MLDDLLGSDGEANQHSGREPSSSNYSGNHTDSSIDQLLRQKSWILKTKLEVWAYEIVERLRLRALNLRLIDEGKTKLSEALQQIPIELTFRALGLPLVPVDVLERGPEDRRSLYQRMFDLEKEEREQEVECWRDIVDVLRDLLVVWEAHEQAKAKAIFLKYAG